MKKPKILLISSSGGHFEQLMMLKPIIDKYNCKIITEKTNYKIFSDYKMIQTGSKDPFVIFKMFINSIKSFFIFIKERPKFIISTGTLIVLPFVLLGKLFGSKIIYIETFARVYDGTKSGRLVYKYADLFIIQWEPLKAIYPNAIYGGSIY